MNRMKPRVIALITLLVTAAFCGPAFAGGSLMMATTTSTDNTGLLDELIPAFTADTGIDLKWTATGTGKALKMGENCDVDVLMVHAPPAEKTYVDKGFGTKRYEIMYNDFVLIGPKANPAGVSGSDVAAALKTIKAKKALFMSRGDNSGTNKKEIFLWKSAGTGVPERESWYIQTGQGMLATIRIAEERGGYTMTDRGTYIKYAAGKNGDPELVIVVEGADELKNQYSVIPVNPKHCPSAQYDLAVQFSEWITGARAQQQIEAFRLMGKPLFIPNASR